MSLWSIILAAGSSTRLRTPDQTLSKQFLPYRGDPLFWSSARTLAGFPAMQGLVLVFPPARLGELRELVARLAARDGIGVEWVVTAGGSTRQESSRLGLGQLPPGCGRVLVHDAARPFVTPQVIQRLVHSLDSGDAAVVPGVPVTDTVRMTGGQGGLRALDRDRLVATQTPQGFDRKVLEHAHGKALEQGQAVTDDASMVEWLGQPVALVRGDPSNIKITSPEDLALLQTSPPPARTCTGLGYDVHRYGPGRPLKLGGVPITNGPEVVAHSDGDVLLHALIDALLGCLGRGDIGELFPDSEAAFEGIASGVLLSEVLALCSRQGLVLSHVDMTVICQVPRLTPWKEQIRKNVSALLGLDREMVNIKATTEEGLGFTGDKKGIKAVALVTGTLPSSEKANHAF
ncbi:MAG: 2-C-methyl-D-erythritol 4-phosphate cytidylyltransferase [Desulfohalobiaceae bacterium]